MPGRRRRFLYTVTLYKPWTITAVLPVPKKPQTFPTVLSPDEVFQFLAGVASVRQRAILTTCYAAGLRVWEAVHLRVRDIDSRRMVLRVAQGKGQKDRDVMLSPKLLDLLRDWWLDWIGDPTGRHPGHSGPQCLCAVQSVRRGIPG